MNRKPLINLALAALVFIIVLGTYALWYSSVELRSQEAATLAEEIRQRGEVGGRTALARKALEDLAVDEASVYRFFVSDDEIVPFLESLERTGVGLGSEIKVVSVRLEGEGADARIALAVSITGSFDAVLRTLGAIEYQAYDTRLSTLTLNTTGMGVWTAAANIAVAALPQAATTSAQTATTTKQ